MVDFVLSCVVIVAAITLWFEVDGLEDASAEERDRRLGGTGQLALFNDALRTREVPSAADRDAWIHELKGENVRLPTSVKILTIILVAAISGRIVNDALTASVNEVLAALAFTIGAVALIWIGLRLVRRIRKKDSFDARELLLAELEKDPPDDS